MYLKRPPAEPATVLGVGFMIRVSVRVKVRVRFSVWPIDGAGGARCLFKYSRHLGSD